MAQKNITRSGAQGNQRRASKVDKYKSKSRMSMRKEEWTIR